MPEQMMDDFQRGSAAVIGPRTEALLAEGQHVMLEISGDSMRPTLKPGRDAAVLEPMQSWPPERGDILFYRSQRSPSGYALHRVFRMRADGPIMNGDAQGWIEGPLAREQVLAKAVMLMRNGEPFDIEKRSYRTYVSLWRLTRHFRKPMFAIWRAVKKIVRRA